MENRKLIGGKTFRLKYTVPHVTIQKNIKHMVFSGRIFCLSDDLSKGISEILCFKSRNRKLELSEMSARMMAVFADEPYMRELSNMVSEKRKKGERIMGRDIATPWVNLGRKDGRKEVWNLVSLMIRDGRISELDRSASDKKFRKKLMKEYGLIGKKSKHS